MAYFTDPQLGGYVVCMICWIPVPNQPIYQEYGSPADINCKEKHLEWHKEEGHLP